MKKLYSFFAFLLMISLNSKSFSQINIGLSKTDATCNGYCDGTMTANVTGGTPPYTYIWSNGSNTPNLSQLCAGTYSITVYDVNLDSAVVSETISSPTTLSVTVISTDPSCSGDANGTATATVTGGTPGYTYIWGNAQIGSVISGVGSGTYTVTVTDTKSCTNSGSVTISNPSSLTLSVIGTNPSCNGGANGSATAIACGGVPGYSYA